MDIGATHHGHSRAGNLGPPGPDRRIVVDRTSNLHGASHNPIYSRAQRLVAHREIQRLRSGHAADCERQRHGAGTCIGAGKRAHRKAADAAASMGERAR